ncbi:hypothetical protein ACFWGD_09465 [Corynebacterium sp. NPDC060344]|uniref:hypothetical protein n=1 Tax=Corynebacterium sp. NPDC060344 TaxID=3347101 RepID=UPI003656B5B9
MSASRLVRGAFALCLTTFTAASLVACTAEDGGGGDDRIVGKRWQVTEVYDDPALPRGVPAGTVPPTIAFGRESYTGDGACGEFQGTLTWRDGDIVAIGEPETVRETDCDAAARTFDDRLRAQLAGEFVVEAPDPDLRMTAVGDHPAGEAAPGWAAVSRG